MRASASSQRSEPATAATTPTGPVDVLLCGKVFADFSFTGLAASPAPGREVWASQMDFSAGGIATKAVAAARLGARCTLITTLSDDIPGRFCDDFLRHEGVDLSRCRRVGSWPTPTTVSFSYGHDRAMVTYESAEPAWSPAYPAAARVILAQSSETVWWRDHAAAGSEVVVDSAWEDAATSWDLGKLRACLAGAAYFVPNEAEALAYARTTDIERALDTLLELVPAVVVTLGADGAIAASTHEPGRVRIPAIRCQAVDPLGAGDVFAGAFAVATCHGWPLAQRVCFAVAAAGLCAQTPGSARSAPTLAGLLAWQAGLPPAERPNFDFLTTDFSAT